MDRRWGWWRGRFAALRGRDYTRGMTGDKLTSWAEQGTGLLCSQDLIAYCGNSVWFANNPQQYSALTRPWPAPFDGLHPHQRYSKESVCIGLGFVLKRVTKLQGFQNPIFLDSFIFHYLRNKRMVFIKIGITHQSYRHWIQPSLYLLSHSRSEPVPYSKFPLKPLSMKALIYFEFCFIFAPPESR